RDRNPWTTRSLRRFPGGIRRGIRRPILIHPLRRFGEGAAHGSNSHTRTGAPERAGSAITFPRLVGYRYDLGEDRITAKFTDDSKIVLSPQDIPTRVEVAPVIGEHAIHTIDDLKQLRDQQVVFLLAKLVLQKFFQDEDEQGNRTPKS